MFRAHVLIVRRAKIVLYSLWYHDTEKSEWSKIPKIIKIIKIQFYKYEHMVVKFMCKILKKNICNMFSKKYLRILNVIERMNSVNVIVFLFSVSWELKFISDQLRLLAS